MRRLLTGAVAGGAATVPMSAVMLAARRTRVMRSRQPPEEIVERASARAGLAAGPAELRPVAAAAHLAFGAAAGAVFALVARGPRIARLAEGLAFGAGVWFVSYRGWLPELGLMPDGARDEPERQATMLVAHLVYGAALGVVTVR
jgi:uncharacterized membrane protein YagU involved in acid resistance